MKIQEMANEKNTKKTSNRRSNDQKAGSCSSNKKRNESSDNDDSSSDDDMDMDDHEYRKLLSKMFPSKHMDKKVESGEKLFLKKLVK